MDFNKSKKRGRKGEGRSTVFKPLNLPVELIEELRLYKSIYETVGAEKKDRGGNPIPLKLSYEQILRHWMSNVRLFDPKVADHFDQAMSYRSKQPKTFEVDPTEGDVWEMQYFFTNDEGDEIPALINRDSQEFMAQVSGYCESHAQMETDDWRLINDAGLELSREQGHIVARRILEHEEKIK